MTAYTASAQIIRAAYRGYRTLYNRRLARRLARLMVADARAGVPASELQRY